MKTNDEIEYLCERLEELYFAWGTMGYTDLEISSVLFKMAFSILETNGMDSKEHFIEFAQGYFSEYESD